MKILKNYKVFYVWYILLYKIASIAWKNLNICQFENGYCRTGSRDGCCSKCEHLTKNGCSTKNTFCRVFMCPSVLKVNSKWRIKLLVIIRKILVKPFKGEYIFYKSPEQVFEKLLKIQMRKPPKVLMGKYERLKILQKEHNIFLLNNGRKRTYTGSLKRNNTLGGIL